MRFLKTTSRLTFTACDSPLTPTACANQATEAAGVIFKHSPNDVEYDTLCIDPVKIRQLISSKTVAILPVHFGGMACNLTEINKIAKFNNLHDEDLNKNLNISIISITKNINDFHYFKKICWSINKINTQIKKRIIIICTNGT